jgi:hypothetical protein
MSVMCWSLPVVYTYIVYVLCVSEMAIVGDPYPKAEFPQKHSHAHTYIKRTQPGEDQTVGTNLTMI